MFNLCSHKFSGEVLNKHLQNILKPFILNNKTQKAIISKEIWLKICEEMPEGPEKEKALKMNDFPVLINEFGYRGWSEF